MVDYIKYDGKDYPIKIAFAALNNFEKEAGIPLTAMGEELKNHEILCWHALVAGHKMEKKEMTLVREDVEMVLSESLKQFMDIFMSSMVQMQTDLSGVEPNKKK